MTTPATHDRSRPTKVAQAEAEFTSLLAAALRPGFHGTAGIVLALQDGHIQHLRVSLERRVQ